MPGDEGGVSRLRGLWCKTMCCCRGGETEGDGDDD